MHASRRRRPEALRAFFTQAAAATSACTAADNGDTDDAPRLAERLRSGLPGAERAEEDEPGHDGPSSSRRGRSRTPRKDDTAGGRRPVRDLVIRLARRTQTLAAASARSNARLPTGTGTRTALILLMMAEDAIARPAPRV